MEFTGDSSVVDSSVVSRSIDVSPVHSYERSGWIGQRQTTWGMLVLQVCAERDKAVGVHLQMSYEQRDDGTNTNTDTNSCPKMCLLPTAQRTQTEPARQYTVA